MHSSTLPALAKRSSFHGRPRHSRPETQMLVSITIRTASPGPSLLAGLVDYSIDFFQGQRFALRCFGHDIGHRRRSNAFQMQSITINPDDKSVRWTKMTRNLPGQLESTLWAKLSYLHHFALSILVFVLFLCLIGQSPSSRLAGNSALHRFSAAMNYTTDMGRREARPRGFGEFT